MCVHPSAAQGTTSGKERRTKDSNCIHSGFRMAELRREGGSLAQRQTPSSSIGRRQPALDCHEPRPPSLLCLADVSRCFGLPLYDAAQQLGLCSSVLKRESRRLVRTPPLRPSFPSPCPVCLCVLLSIPLPHSYLLCRLSFVTFLFPTLAAPPPPLVIARA